MREYMPFTEEIRERMLSLHFDQWSAELIKMVPQYGKTMEQSAREAYEAGLIERRYYLLYAQGTKAMQERKEQRDKDDAEKNH